MSIALVGGPVFASDDSRQDSNPIFSTRSFASAGLYFPDRALKFRLDGSVPTVESTIDFSERFDLASNDETAAFELGWRFSANWMLRGQYFNVDASSAVTLAEDAQWGDFRFNEGTGIRAGSDVSGPMSNFGAWYIHSLSPRWAANVRADWLDVSVDGYDGRIVNAAVGLNYAPSEHFGVGVNYNFFEIDFGIRESDWRGRAVNRFDGFYVFLSGYR